jgi:hypothetical protein
MTTARLKARENNHRAMNHVKKDGEIYAPSRNQRYAPDGMSIIE